MEKTTISVEDFAMRNCAAVPQRQESQPTSGSRRTSPEPPRSTFECKICGRTFESSQTLRRHRTCNKKVALTENSGAGSPGKGSTVHECGVCGLRFPTKRTLGGHMGKHRRKRKRGDEDGGEEAKKKRVETGSLGGSEMVMRSVSPFDLNLPPVPFDLNQPPVPFDLNLPPADQETAL